MLSLAVPPADSLAAPSNRATLAGNVPSWASSSNFKGPVSGSDTVGFRLYLGWQNDAAVEATARAVSDPRSASYGHYLSPEQFRHQFAPTQSAVGSVKSWLTSQGFSVLYTPQNNHYVAAEGTIAQASAAFGTTFGYYSVDGKVLRSPSSDISTPTSLATLVSGVVGLDESAALVHNNVAAEPDASPSAGFRAGRPCAAFWREKTTADLAGAQPPTNPYGASPLPLAPCGYTPQQVRGSYGLAPQPSATDGSGVSVAIIDAYASPTIQSDLDTWSVARGIPTTRITQVVAPGTFRHPESGGKNKQNPQGWYGEQTLDVEAVHGMAPGAHIVYVGAPNNFQDLDAAMNHVVDKGLAQIVTNSYGFNTEKLAPGFIKPLEQTLMQGAAEGIGIYFSSGDNGDESTVDHYVSTDFPASSPWVTAVGGTSLAVGGSLAAPTRLFETGWATFSSSWKCAPLAPAGCTQTWTPKAPGKWLYGAGGGVSCLFGQPDYQSGLGNRAAGAQSLCPGHVGRAVPDVSAIGDPNTGYLVGQTQAFAATLGAPASVQYDEYRIGGTSLSSPITAGIMALVDQARALNGLIPLGFANPRLYGLSSSALNDIVPPASTVAVVRVNYANGEDASGGLTYRLRTMDHSLSLNTGTGWDDVTGLGTPNAGFIGALNH